MPAMPVPIEIERLSKRFGASQVLDQISLHIEPGELFFLLGPSGCGKTTLLRCLAGLCDPDEGRIFIGGDDITHAPPHLRDTGMVFQSYALWPHMTLRENVAFGLEMRGISPAEIRRRSGEALERVRLADRADSKPNQLSGGQQQRVALARALVIQPRCILLDEPLSNLDAKLRIEMRAEIRSICKAAGLTAVYVTHDQKEALSIADRLAVLEAGRIRQMGRPQEVYLRPATRFVAGFIGETNFLPATVASISPDGLVLRSAAGEWTSAAAVSKDWNIGDPAWISLRPEVFHLHTPPPNAPNVFTAHVQDTVYMGEMAQHQILLPSEASEPCLLKAIELHPKMAADKAPLSLWVEPDDVVVLKN